MLEHAADLIDGDRDDDYGSPAENFENIAKLWNVRFGRKLFGEEKFTASDVADAMILVKAARSMTRKTEDTYADIAGYAACAHEIEFGEPENADKQQIKMHTKIPDNCDVTAVARELQDQLDRAYRRGRYCQ